MAAARRETKGKKAGKTRKAVASVPERDGKTVKMTVYARPDQVISIDLILLNKRIEDEGKRTTNKNQLLREAIDLVVEKYENQQLTGNNPPGRQDRG